METSRPVAVIGSGYVGTVVAGCLAHLGHEVVGIEMEPSRLAALRSARAPFHEAKIDDILRGAAESGRLCFTDDLAGAVADAGVVFLCVGTPPGNDGHADVGAVQEAAQAAAAASHDAKVFVTKSTVPIGSGHWLENVVEDARPRDAEGKVAIVSNPEFLRQGSAVDDFLYPDRIVLGSDDPDALEEVAELYAPVADQCFDGADASRRPRIVRTDLATAETAKYAANAFLALKISFANEMAAICERVGADVVGVTDAVGLDRRIGPSFLAAGIGWGGSCFGKDLGELIATARDHDYDANLLRAAVDVNHGQRALVVQRLRCGLHGLRGRRVGLLGLAFKPGTDDLRDAPAVEIATALVDAGAIVTAHDPVVRAIPGHDAIRVVDDPYDVGHRADAVALLTEWPEYRDLELGVLRDGMRGTLFVDGRNVFDPAKAASVGLDYVGVGRSTPARAR